MSHEREECVVVMGGGGGGGGGGQPGEERADTVRSVSKVIREREEEPGRLVLGLASTFSGCLDAGPQVRHE